MTAFRAFIKSLQNPFNLAMTLLAVWGSWATIYSAAKTLGYATLPLLLLPGILALAIWLIVRGIRAVKPRQGAKVYDDWDKVDDSFKVDQTLSLLLQNKLTLEVIGRTCLRWLCGEESDLKTNQARFDLRTTELQGLIARAIENGSDIHFVLQGERVSASFLSEEDNARLDGHARLSIRSFEQIRSKLSAKDAKRLRMSFVDDVVYLSVVRLIADTTIRRVVIDLNTSFKGTPVTREAVSIPIIVFPHGMDVNSTFMRSVEVIIKKAVDYGDLYPDLKPGLDRVERLAADFPHYSSLRNDQSANLIPHVSQVYLNKVAGRKPAVAPLSVQFLVTNRCTTKCTMCDHYLIDAKGQRKTPELNAKELGHVFDCIADLGTRAVIVSGGEPLARSDLLPVLKHAKNDLGLAIGLLTNGIRPGGKSLSKEDAIALSETCKWIQVSIDSFDPVTYQAIRPGGTLEAALETLRLLDQHGNCPLEICYTIQRANLGEVAGLEQKVRSMIPARVHIRLKFAHGSEGRSKQKFLCSKKDLEDTVRALSDDDRLVNFGYLSEMIKLGYFTYRGLADGRPLEDRMRNYHDRKYTCKVLSLSCKIDPYGDLYPCCFLFDDNNATSEIRPKFRIGSLRTEAGVSSPRGGKNQLAELWFKSNELEKLRERQLPIDEVACAACTRHFYQNEYLNDVVQILDKEKTYRLAELLAERRDSVKEPVWL
jgi:MoaA/NifB/PqqE/SkfB family radical SAM enzyme